VRVISHKGDAGTGRQDRTGQGKVDLDFDGVLVYATCDKWA